MTLSSDVTSILDAWHLLDRQKQRVGGDDSMPSLGSVRLNSIAYNMLQHAQDHLSRRLRWHFEGDRERYFEGDR